MPGEIQLEELTKAFGEHVAVAGIDVDMPPGSSSRCSDRQAAGRRRPCG
jgi:hypothetical protein